jgi:hypothetical protein
MKFKKPSNTICLVVVLLLVFILISGAFVYSQIYHLVTPLGETEIISGKVIIDSPYVELDVIEQENQYTILRDKQTDVLYIELRRNGYSSAVTVLLNEDGTPKKYSQFIDG